MFITLTFYDKVPRVPKQKKKKKKSVLQVLFGVTGQVGHQNPSVSDFENCISFL
jgi:hypothetical protein